MLDAHLAGREWVVGGAPTIADLALFAYISRRRATPALEQPRPRSPRWARRGSAPCPGFVDDFVTYPDNARPGARALDLRLVAEGTVPLGCVDDSHDL